MIQGASPKGETPDFYVMKCLPRRWRYEIRITCVTGTQEKGIDAYKLAGKK
jgi:hypothetical protein